MKLFKKKVRVIPESYLRSLKGSGDASVAAPDSPEAAASHADLLAARTERDRQLARTLRFAQWFLGFIPSAFYFVYMIGFIYSGFAMDDPSVEIPIAVILTLGFAGFLISLIWETEGGLIAIGAGIVLAGFMLYLGSDMLQLFIYPLPFAVSGICAIYSRATRKRYRLGLKELRESTPQETPVS